MPTIVTFETIPELFSDLFDYFQGQNKTALRYKDKKSNEWVDITWDELRDRVYAMMGFLSAQGVTKGDRVAILAENRPEWAVTDMAMQLLGAINVSLYTSLPADQVEYIMKDSGARVFVVSAGIQYKKATKIFDACEALEHIVTMSEPKDEIPSHVTKWHDAIEMGKAEFESKSAELLAIKKNTTADEVSSLIYTSGTTGSPKGVMLTHRNFCSNVSSALERFPFGPSDHHLSFLPLCHSFERTAGYHGILAAGGTISYAESIDSVSKNLPEVKPTVMISVPRLFERVYNVLAKTVEEGSAVKKGIFKWAVKTGGKYAKAEKPSAILKAQNNLAQRLVFSKLHVKLGGNVRFAVSGGAALPKVIGEFFQAAGLNIIEGYGLTETAPVLSANDVDNPKFGSVGFVFRGITVGIQDLDSKEIIAQQEGANLQLDLNSAEGEIVAKGPNVMKGYWKNEAATKEAIDSEGWYHTGDIGKFEGGQLKITDRLKHMIVSKGGKNIYPGPIEENFVTDPLIDQLMVVGEGREFLTALVVPGMDALINKAKTDGWIYSKPSELFEMKEAQDLYAGVFKSYSRNAAAHEKIRGFRLIQEPFTVDNGYMTPTMKIKRKAIDKDFVDIINEMYKGVV